MNRKKISRREALGVIGKGGAVLGGGTCFFLCLKTTPLSAAPRQTDRLRRRVTRAAMGEKVLISGEGSVLAVKISGPAGRYCAVSYATSDDRDAYQLFPESRAVIGRDGLCTLRLDTGRLPNQKIYLRVVTGNTAEFDDDYSGTEAFVIHISKGVISRYEGVLSRPLVNAKSAAAAATFAAAGARAKRR